MTTRRQFMFLGLTACIIFSIAAVNSVAAFLSDSPRPMIWLALTAGIISCMQLLVLLRLKDSISGINDIAENNIATVTLDEHDIIQKCSQHFAEVMQSTPAALLGKSLQDIVKTDGEEPLLQATADNSVEAQVVANQDCWLELNRLGAPNTHVIIASDISDRKMAESLSMLDALTGLRNRNAYDIEMPSMVRKAQRNDSYLTIAILNFDLFNEFNTSYGHEEGDKALHQVAEAMKIALRRPTDHCYRLTSDEFVIVFEHDFPNVCRRALDKTLKTVENLHIPQQNSPISAFLTASIGAFGARGMQLSDPENVYMTADLQLYKAKQTRNCVHSFFPNETVQLRPEALDRSSVSSAG